MACQLAPGELPHWILSVQDTGPGLALNAIVPIRQALYSIEGQGPVALGDTRWGSGTNTYCETYVEWRTGIGNQGATAFAAYLHLAAQGLVHTGPPAPGALVYFAPASDNAFDGHVGLYDGAGLFTSVTYYGVQQEPMAGWRAPYLGWVDPAAIAKAG